MDISRMAGKLDQLGFIVNPISPAAECGLSNHLLVEMPEKKFYKVCKLCQYMKMITLEDTLNSLQLMRHEITLDEEVRQRAEKALRRMFELS